jgi:hypothetical protein
MTDVSLLAPSSLRRFGKLDDPAMTTAVAPDADAAAGHAGCN